MRGATIQLTLVPLGAGRYSATLCGEIVVSSRTPFFAAARALIAHGRDPETPVTARHQGSSFDALASTLGEAAKWSISETDRAGIRRVKWAPNPMFGGNE